MKKYTRLLIVAAVLAPFFAGSIAMAEPNPALTDQQKTDLAKRLTERKTELKTRLTTAEQAKFKAKCTTAQGVISSLGQRVKGIETSRTQVYGNVTDNLTKLAAKLKDKGIDTAKLDGEITTLKTKITTFNTDLTSYKQAVEDLKDMDCVADPTAFKASLEAARTSREKVSKDATDIRTYLSDPIKPTLKDLRAQVTAKQTTSDSEGQ